MKHWIKRTFGGTYIDGDNHYWYAGAIRSAWASAYLSIEKKTLNMKYSIQLFWLALKTEWTQMRLKNRK